MLLYRSAPPVMLIAATILLLGNASAMGAGKPAARAELAARLHGTPAEDCLGNCARVYVAILHYASEHDWHLPPDLGATLPYVLDEYSRPMSPAEAAKYYVCPLSLPNVRIPRDPTPKWINEHTSYGYLGGADVNPNALPPELAASTIILYEKAAHAHPEMNPDQVIAVPLGFDKTGPVYPRKAIDRAREAWDATRSVPFDRKECPILSQTWGRLQDLGQAAMCAYNLAMVRDAVYAYQRQHDGRFPPTLGDTLQYVVLYDLDTGKKISPTRAQAAAVYLCPGNRDIEIPKDVAPDWINRHTSYVYLGDDRLVDGKVDSQAVILYERLPVSHGNFGNVAYADLHIEATPADQIPALVAGSKKLLKSARARSENTPGDDDKDKRPSSSMPAVPPI